MAGRLPCGAAWRCLALARPVTLPWFIPHKPNLQATNAGNQVHANEVDTLHRNAQASALLNYFLECTRNIDSINRAVKLLRPNGMLFPLLNFLFDFSQED